MGGEGTAPDSGGGVGLDGGLWGWDFEVCGRVGSGGGGGVGGSARAGVGRGAHIWNLYGLQRSQWWRGGCELRLAFERCFVLWEVIVFTRKDGDLWVNDGDFKVRAKCVQPRSERVVYGTWYTYHDIHMT